MLQLLHNTASSFFIKILLVLLVASFALWGIGDVFRSGSSSQVVQVGDTAVGAQEFHNEMQQEMQEYRQMLGRQYSPELLKTLGIPQQVLNKLIERKLVELEAAELGISIPDSHIKSELRSNPMFHGDNGRFDAEQFRLLLRSNGMTESYYVSLLEKETAANMVMQSAFSGLRVTDTASNTAHRYANEVRVVDVLLFTPDLVKDIADPSPSELSQYYEKHAENFRAAEHRVISLLTLDAASLAASMEISDEDVLAEYEERIDEFEQPEKRDVHQLLFTDEDTAKEAVKRLESGKSMDVVGKELEAVNDNVKLGLVSASGVIPEAEKTVFALDKNTYSKPVQSSFGWHIFRVTDIQPRRTRPFAEVKQELAEVMRNERAGDEVYQLSNALQDDLAGGASMEEAARSIGAKIQVVGPVSAAGTSPDGTKVALPTGYEEALGAAFELEEGEVSQLMETEGGAYYAVRADSIQPERTRALDEIRGTVLREWKEVQREKALYQLASGISENLSSGDVAAVAGKTGAKLLRGKEVRRDSTEIADSKPIPAMMLSAVFAAEKGTATDAFALHDGSYAVAKLNTIRKAEVDSADGKRGMEKARENLRALYADEFYTQYMRYLRDKHGVSAPNQALIDQILQ